MVELPTVVPRIDDRDWSNLTLGERIRQLEVEGYLLIPDMLSSEQIERIQAQVRTLETMGMDYSERQRTASQIMFMGGEATELGRAPDDHLVPEDVARRRPDLLARRLRALRAGPPRYGDPHRCRRGHRAARDCPGAVLPERPHTRSGRRSG